MSSKSDSKKPNIFERMGRGIKDMIGEMKKVVWPTKEQAINNTLIVLAFVVVMGVVIWLFDLGITSLVGLLLGLK